MIFFTFLLSPFNRKLREGIVGRFNSLKHLKMFKSSTFKKKYWFHVASHGEFQQIETIIDSIKEDSNDVGIIVSFFSPSGFNNVNSQNIDCKIYLPFDFPITILKALKIVNPDKIFFTSNDLWPNFIFFAKLKKIELILSSARVHEEVNFSLEIKNFYQRIFIESFSKILTISKHDYDSISKNVSSSKIFNVGNPRFDRIVKNVNPSFIRYKNHKIVLERDKMDDVQHWFKNELKIKQKNMILILASLWNEDNQILFPEVFEFLQKDDSRKIVIVPHEISNKTISDYISIIEKTSFSFKVIDTLCNISDLKERVIIVNKVGFLSTLYSQTHIAYVGGGFSKNGVHNLTEPAASRNPVIFGPNYNNSNRQDAVSLINTSPRDSIYTKLIAESREGVVSITSAGYTINNSYEFKKVLDDLCITENHNSSSAQARNHVWRNLGATERIMEIL